MIIIMNRVSLVRYRRGIEKYSIWSWCRRSDESIIQILSAFYIDGAKKVSLSYNPTVYIKQSSFGGILRLPTYKGKEVNFMLVKYDKYTKYFAIYLDSRCKRIS